MTLGVSSRLPALFVGHGTPMNAIERNSYTEAWRQFGRSLPRPRAILSVSAHWFVRGTKATAMKEPRTIHDFAGFPQELFEVEYPAAGDPALAEDLRERLAPVPVALDHAWGLDHGTWSVLTHLFPEADVPVVQLSLDRTQPPSFHYDLGARLAPLRDRGILVLGSGNAVHNLGAADFNPGAPPLDWAVRFNTRVRDHLERRDHRPLIEYDRLGADARLAVPTPDHYLPLLTIIAQQDDNERVSFLVDGIDAASISMLSVVVG
jgi:4,5-DOPA dioxygenase extradiol